MAYILVHNQIQFFVFRQFSRSQSNGDLIDIEVAYHVGAGVWVCLIATWIPIRVLYQIKLVSTAPSQPTTLQEKETPESQPINVHVSNLDDLICQIKEGNTENNTAKYIGAGLGGWLKYYY